MIMLRCCGCGGSVVIIVVGVNWSGNDKRMDLVVVVFLRRWNSSILHSMSTVFVPQSQQEVMQFNIEGTLYLALFWCHPNSSVCVAVLELLLGHIGGTVHSSDVK